MSSEVAASGAGLISLLPMVIIFAIFYFLLIRPQVKKQRKIEQMVKEVQKGDQVIVAGGLYGVVAKVEDNIVYVEIAENIKIKAVKSSIVEVLNKEAEKDEKADKSVDKSVEKAKLAAKAKPTAKAKPAKKKV